MEHAIDELQGNLLLPGFNKPNSLRFILVNNPISCLSYVVVSDVTFEGFKGLKKPFGGSERAPRLGGPVAIEGEERRCRPPS